MRKPISEPRRSRRSMSLLLLQIREKDILLSRNEVAGDIHISARTINSAENIQKVSGEVMLRLFHYYIFIGRVTPIKFRLFFFLLHRLIG